MPNAGTIETHFKERSVRGITRQISRSGAQIGRSASVGSRAIKRQIHAARQWWEGAQGNEMTWSADLPALNGNREAVFVDLSRRDQRLLKRLSKDIESQVHQLSGDDGSAPAFDDLQPAIQPMLGTARRALSAQGKIALDRLQKKQRLNEPDSDKKPSNAEYRLRLFSLSNDCRMAARKDGRQLLA